MKKFSLLIVLLLFFPIVQADYSIKTICQPPCDEGDNATFEVKVWYDVKLMADEQKELYRKDNLLAQTYVSSITVRKIILKEKVSGWVFAEQDTYLTFADSRIEKNKNLNQDPKTEMIYAILPGPTTEGELDFVPCFEIEYEKELKEFDFFEGDYDSTFLIDSDTICGDKIIEMKVNNIPEPLCTLDSCVFFKHCTPDGCRISWVVVFSVLFVIFVLLSLERYLSRYLSRRR